MKAALTFIGLTTLLMSVMGASNKDSQYPDGFFDEVLVRGLNTPMGVEFFPDGRALYFEMMGNIYITDFRQKPINYEYYMQMTDVNADGERGLMDIALSPDFANSSPKYIYIYWAKRSTVNFRLSRFTHIENGGLLTSRCLQSSEFMLWEDGDGYPGPFHFGGQLSFGPDGALYISQGDKTIDKWAQDMSHYAGKIIRVNPDGTFPADNLGVRTGTLPGIWMTGVRNGFRSSWDLQTNNYYIWVVGGNDQSTAWESIFIGNKDLNLGWPYCEGYVSASSPNKDFLQCDPTKYTSPMYSYKHYGANACIIGGTIYRGNRYPAEYRNRMFISDYSQQWIKVLTLDTAGTRVLDEQIFVQDAGKKIISYITGPDGLVYYTTYGGDVGRFQYTGTVDTGLFISYATASAIQGEAPLLISFEGDAVDPDGNTVKFKWLFGDDAQTTQGGKKSKFTYTTPGNYEAYLQVTNGVTTVISTAIFIQVKSSYKIKVLSPANGIFFSALDVVNIQCGVTGTIDEGVTDYINVIFKHDDHTHPVTTFYSDHGTLVVPNSGHDVYGDTGFFITCELRNKKSQTISSHSVFLYPNKINFTVDTYPTHLSVNLEGVPATTPVNYGSLKGFEHVFEALTTQCYNGYVYKFTHWSDGGAQSHMATVSEDTTFIAYYEPTSERCTVLQDEFIAFHAVADSGITLKSGTSSVTNWADLSQNQIDLTPVSSTSPTLVKGGLNGHNYVSFNGIDNGLGHPKAKGLPYGSADRTLMMVVRYEGPGWGGFTYGDAICDAVFGLGVTAVKANYYPENFCNADQNGSGVNAVAKGWVIHTGLVRDHDVEMYVDGVLLQQDTRTDLDTPEFGDICLGMEQSLLSRVKMNVAELYVFSLALNPAQRAYFESGLREKYFASGSGDTTSSPSTTTVAPTTTTTAPTSSGPKCPVTSGLVMNLDADQLVQTSDGIKVTVWGDLFNANNLKATNNSPTLMQKKLNGHNYVAFSGDNDALQKTGSTPGIPSKADSRSVFMAVRYNSVGDGGFIWGPASSAKCKNVFGLGMSKNSKLYLETLCKKRLESSSPDALGEWMIHSVTLNNKVLVQSKNGLAVSSFKLKGKTKVGKIVLGSTFVSGVGLEMDVAEILVYDLKLTAADQDAVITYLKAKYAIN